MKMSKEERLKRALLTENDKIDALEYAATNYADGPGKSPHRQLRALKDAARTYTNAYHHRSRCEKAVRA